MDHSRRLLLPTHGHCSNLINGIVSILFPILQVTFVTRNATSKVAVDDATKQLEFLVSETTPYTHMWVSIQHTWWLILQTQNPMYPQATCRSALWPISKSICKTWFGACSINMLHLPAVHWASTPFAKATPLLLALMLSSLHILAGIVNGNDTW